MNVLKKLDRSSKTLILISLIGIILALAGFFYLNKQGAESTDGKMVVGKVTLFQNDTRVKRSDNIHWYPVSQTTDCFEDDLIFTGGDSTATVQFPSGDTITLHPNSLISLSQNHVSLESGAIEVDLSSETPMKLETFGEKFVLKEKSKVRVIQSDKGQKIIPLNEVAKTIKTQEAVKKYIENEELTITAPKVGKVFPNLDNYIIQLKWNTTLQNKNFEIAFSNGKSKTPFATVKTETNSADVPLKNFPEGLIYWKVTSANGAIDESSFFLTKDLDIKLNYPSNNDVLPLPTLAAAEFTPSWNAPLEFSQRLQVATDNSFAKPIFDDQSVTGQKLLKIQKEGKYFWRVGYQLQNDLVKWSTPSEFSVKADIVISPIEIQMASSVFDFSLNKTYTAEVKDKNPCESYQFIILKGQEILSEMNSKTPSHTFQKMDDGQYTLKVIGNIQNKPVVETSHDFEVKTSLPLQAPKIIKKKRKLFVKVLESILNSIVPSSVAAENEAIAPLSWEGPANATYEVEIANTPGGKTVLKKQVTGNSVDFKVPRPGTYFWRVRYQEGGQWSPFSDYDEIQVEDKAQLVERPLMVSPYAEAQPKLGKNGEITFTWQTPYPDFEYSLEIYSSLVGEPIKVIPVTGETSKTLKFKNKPSSFFWRVMGKSKHGNLTKDTTKYRFTIVPEEPVVPVVAKESSWKKGDLILTGLISQTSMSYDQEIDNSNFQQINKEVNLSGQTFWLNAEFWPTSFGNGKHGISLGLDYASLSSGESSVKEMEFTGEYGRLLAKSEKNTHKGFIGIHHSTLDLSIDANTKSNFSVSYLSGRYNFNHILTDKWSLNLNSELLVLLQTDLAMPSIRLRPMAQYQIRKNLWANAFVGFERNIAKPNYDESGAKGNLTINMQNIHYGLGLTWQH